MSKKKLVKKNNLQQIGLINIKMDKNGLFKSARDHSVDIAPSKCSPEKTWKTKETPDQSHPETLSTVSGGNNSGIPLPKTMRLVILAIALIGIIIIGVATMSNATETFNAIFKLLNLM